MDNGSLIIVLALATLTIGIAVAVWQRARVARLKNDPERSAFVKDHGGPARPNRPGVEH